MFFESRNRGRFRFFPKGRRLGATRGAAQAFIEKMCDGEPLMWGDTTHSNIERYVARYFIPVMNKNNIVHNWRADKSLMLVGDRGGYCDFRSADRPENWEGFGYKTIFLNESGIILDDPYLYENAVLPMLMDFKDSELIAAGTPKLRQGKGRLFQELTNRARRGTPDYYTRTFTSYDNPFLDRAAIDALKNEMSAQEVQQEIYGEFVEPGGELVKREHLSYACMPSKDEMYISMALDLAISTKTTADYTAAVVMGREKYGAQRTFVLDAQRRRIGFKDVLTFVSSMAEKWHPQIIGIEKVQYQAAVIETLLIETSLPIVEVIPDSDKLTRFMPLATRYEKKMIYHAQDEHGNDLISKDFEDELLSFNGAKGGKDDQVDAAGYAFSLLPQGAGIVVIATGAREEAPQPASIFGGINVGYEDRGMNGFV